MMQGMLADWRGTEILEGSDIVYAVSSGGGRITMKEGRVLEIGEDPDAWYTRRYWVKVAPLRHQEKYSWEHDRPRKLTNISHITVLPAALS